MRHPLHVASGSMSRILDVGRFVALRMHARDCALAFFLHSEIRELMLSTRARVTVQLGNLENFPKFQIHAIHAGALIMLVAFVALRLVG